MRKSLFGMLAVAAIAAAVTAVPALSDDSGTVAVSVTATAPAAPCVTVTPGSVDFGTLPFSTDNGAGISVGNADGSNPNANLTITFCGTAAGQNLLGSSTPATGPSGSWTPLDYNDGQIHPCPALNNFYVQAFLPFPALSMSGTPTPALQSVGGPAKVFPLGPITTRLMIIMPCRGSNGAGEKKTLTATFTAVLP